MQMSVWQMRDMQDRCFHIVCCAGAAAVLAALVGERRDEVLLIEQHVGTPDMLRWIVAADVLVLALNTSGGLVAPVSSVMAMAGMIGGGRVLAVLVDGGTDQGGESRFWSCRDEVLERARVWRLGALEVLPLVSTPEGCMEPAWHAGPSLGDCLRAHQVRLVDGGSAHAQIRSLEQGGDASCPHSDQFEARLLWLASRALVPGRFYNLRLADQEVGAAVTAIKFRHDLHRGARLAARVLGQDEIATVNVSTKEPVEFDLHAGNPLGRSFSLFDEASGEWVGAGIIDFSLCRASNIYWQSLELNKQLRARLKSQTPRCVWLTGLSGAGKSTIANLLEQRLHADGRHTYVLDGDNVRHGLNRDLGFTEADRVENIRRVGEVARLMVDAGLIVIVSFISPFSSERQLVRSLFEDGEFIEVFVDTPLEECERRDVKGLYAKARSGALKNFTGIDSAYEAPVAPEVHLQAGSLAVEACVEIICEWLE